MKILFLDDMEERHRQFEKYVQKEYPRAKIVHCYSADEAIDCLNDAIINQYYIDEVMLDHDLSIDDIMCEITEQTKEKTGMEVVNFMVANKVDVGHVTVHSMNGPARAEMFARLRDASYNVSAIPFSLIKW